MKNKRHEFAELNKQYDLYMYYGPRWSMVKNHPTTLGWRDQRGEGESNGWADGQGFGSGTVSGNGCFALYQDEGIGYGGGTDDHQGEADGKGGRQ